MNKNHRSLSHYLSNPFLSGTIILTLAGFLTKIIGFFYKIFLARVFHEEGLGVIGLISPVLVLAHALCASGLQHSVTRYVAACGEKEKEQSYGYLYTGILFSLTLSALIAGIIFGFSEEISVSLLHEKRCAPLLRITALSFPLASLHTCFNGFFFGRKKASVPALTMLVEQVVRVLCIGLLYSFSCTRRIQLPLAAASLGLFLGEGASAAVSCIFFLLYTGKQSFSVTKAAISSQKLRELLTISAPLSMNRVCVSLLSALEAVTLPQTLVRSGLSVSQSLSVYGVFSGMAFPLVMFPCALTGAAGSLLLPYISEQQAAGNTRRIRQSFLLTIFCCLLLGAGFMIFLLLFADLLGAFLFQNEYAAKQIRALAFVCPFLYLSGMLNNILHGLGKTFLTFLFSMLSLGLRLFFVFFIVPAVGFPGYLYGILCSQILLDLLLILALRHYIIYN